MKQITKEPYLTETVVFGMHIYRRPGDDSSVIFVDEARDIRKTIIDAFGKFQQFPGIHKEDFWVREVSPSAMEPQIRFRTAFYPKDYGWQVCWTIQPDGFYWADEGGFGAEKDIEVILYTHLDKNGSFTGPFRIGKFGCKFYFD